MTYAQATRRVRPSFVRDLKRLDKAHVDDTPLAEVIDLIIENSSESLPVLRQRNNMHQLIGGWAGSSECDVCNAGDWLLIWRTAGDIALMQRTGNHDELFRWLQRPGKMLSSA